MQTLTSDNALWTGLLNGFVCVWQTLTAGSPTWLLLSFRFSTFIASPRQVTVCIGHVLCIFRTQFIRQIRCTFFESVQILLHLIHADRCFAHLVTIVASVYYIHRQPSVSHSMYSLRLMYSRAHNSFVKYDAIFLSAFKYFCPWIMSTGTSPTWLLALFSFIYGWTNICECDSRFNRLK